ncbi:MAG: FkbM family methyltransferase [Verrucomicrobiota bacterium]
MSWRHFLQSKTLAGHLWREFLVRYRFKYVLPRITSTVLDGVKLDLSLLSLKARNRLLMGIYEAHEKEMCREFLTATDRVLEIGGAIGFIGLFCQTRLGIQQYFVFEANPETFRILQANYALNGIKPRAWNLALASSEETLALDVASDFWENSILPGNASGQTRPVLGAPLKGLLQRVAEKINVLIVDVEGAEQFINLDEIPPEVDKIIIELHPQVLGPTTTYDLIAGLVARGFYVAKEESATFVFLRRSPLPGWSKTSVRPLESRNAPSALQPA